MKLLTVFLTLFLLSADGSDRVTDLVETMRRLTIAGDQPAVGHLVPVLIRELATPHPIPHPMAALAWNQIGVYHATQGQIAEAERAYQRGIRLSEHAGTGGSELALLLLNLGELYLQSGATPSHTEAILRRASKLVAESFGPGASELANFLYMLGAVRMQAGHRKDARTYFERALVVAGETRDGQVRRGIILANLGVLSTQEGQWSQAKDTIASAVTLLEQNLGVGHPELVPCHLNLSRIYAQLKQWDLAAAAVERARVITETRLGPDHGYMVAVLESSAFVLRKTGRRAEAKEQARRAKSIAAALPRATAGGTWIHLSDLR